MIEQATVHLPHADRDTNLPVSIYLVHLSRHGRVTRCRICKTEHAAEPKRAERALFAYHSGARLPTLGRGPGLGG
jgi:hypothetical protein